jgi:lantibiotic transport system permease protein
LLSLEHRNQGWQRLYVLPISRSALYLAKLTVLIALQVGAALTLMMLTWFSIAILQLSGELTLDQFSLGTYSLAMLKGLCGGFVVLTIQHYLSTRWSSFVVPLIVAVAGSLTIPSVAQSERFWKFDPWSYSLVASSASNATAQQLAIVLSLGLATVVVLFALWDIGRRELR